MGARTNGWRRAAVAATAGGALAVGLMAGVGPATAGADVIDDLSVEFTTAAGAGQVAGLLNESVRLRSLGVRPTARELSAVQDALAYRPNQTPLINALQTTVDGQSTRWERAQAASAGPGGFSIGINQYDPTSPGGVSVGPGGINLGGGGFTIGSGR